MADLLTKIFAAIEDVIAAIIAWFKGENLVPGYGKDYEENADA